MKLKVLAFLMVGAVVGACATTSRSDTGIREATTVTVDNQSFADMTIYVSRGQRIRLGLARGHAKTTFTIPPSLVTGSATLQFIADPIGSSRASVSEQITVTEGDSVGLMIPPQ